MNLLKTWVHKNEIDRFVVGKEYRGIVFTGELITLTRCAGGCCARPHIKLLGCIRRSENINLSPAPWLHAPAWEVTAASLATKQRIV